jgi:hypothetical protein
MCVMLTVGWLGACASAMAQALPAFAPRNAPPPGAAVPGGPAPAGDYRPPPPMTDVAPILPPPDVQPTGPSLVMRADYLLWSLPRQALSRFVSSGSIFDPIPGAIGQPGTRLLLNNRFGDDTPHSGLRLYVSLDEGSNPYCSVDASAFVLQRRESQQTFAGNGSINSPVLARPFFNVNAGLEDADPISVPGVQSGALVVDTKRVMYGGETNFRWHYWESNGSRILFSIGPRFLFLEESLETFETVSDLPGLGVPGNQSLFRERYDTNNDFYGGQIGVEWQWRLGPLYVTATSKLALGEMLQKLTTQAATQVFEGATGAVFISPDRALYLAPNNVGTFRRNHFTVMPEVNARLGYDFTNNLGISAGFTYLYISDVIRPANEVDRNVNMQPVGGLGIIPPARTPPSFRTTSFSATGLDASIVVRF